jgi:hypothetical protein
MCGKKHVMICEEIITLSNYHYRCAKRPNKASYISTKSFVKVPHSSFLEVCVL